MLRVYVLGDKRIRFIWTRWRPPTRSQSGSKWRSAAKHLHLVNGLDRVIEARAQAFCQGTTGERTSRRDPCHIGDHAPQYYCSWSYTHEYNLILIELGASGGCRVPSPDAVGLSNHLGSIILLTWNIMCSLELSIVQVQPAHLSVSLSLYIAPPVLFTCRYTVHTLV